MRKRNRNFLKIERWIVMNIKWNNLLSLSALVLSVIFLASCGFRVGDFTASTTKNLNVPITVLEKGQRVSGEDCSNWILFIPIGHIVPDVKSATDQALEKAGANLLIDTVWELERTWYIVGSSECIKVTGTAVKAH